MANIGSGFVSGMVVNGSLSTADWVAGPARARSQLSGITATRTVITLLFLTDLFENLPEATLAAVVIAAVVELVDFASLKRYLYRTRLGRIYGPAPSRRVGRCRRARLTRCWTRHRDRRRRCCCSLPGVEAYVAELGQIPGAGHQYNDLSTFRAASTPALDRRRDRCCLGGAGLRDDAPLAPTPAVPAPRANRLR